MSPLTPAPDGFVPPPYPYDRLAELGAVADAVPGGVVDLSVGTPGDPPPGAVLAALGGSGAARGYPTSVGSAALRLGITRYLARRFAVDVEPGHVALCVGTKEFVASLAWFLRLRDPRRDTVLGPAVAYPTYAMSAALAGCRYVAVPAGADGGPDQASVPAADVERALVLWVNSPANPSGAVFDLASAAAWGREHGVPVCSDECYAEFTWDGTPQTVLAGGGEGVLAVHSLSKRSNLAGIRIGFYAGDPDLVSYLSEVRKHAGLMVPGPVQDAALVAWDDDTHVAEQRRRYQRRLELLATALRAVGVDAALPQGAFYLWVPAPKWARDQSAGDGASPGWVLTEALAHAGLLVSPGDFYGAADFVRMAVVAPDDRLQLAVERLVDSSDPRLRPHASGAAPGLPGDRRPAR
ncbi:MAG: aminotransferase class I/II-fold pyridoxal phosphate-dependent enzyme [Acidimicrobiales bacterium]